MHSLSHTNIQSQILPQCLCVSLTRYNHILVSESMSVFRSSTQAQLFWKGKESGCDGWDSFQHEELVNVVETHFLSISLKSVCLSVCLSLTHTHTHTSTRLCVCAHACVWEKLLCVCVELWLASAAWKHFVMYITLLRAFFVSPTYSHRFSLNVFVYRSLVIITS